MELGKSSKERKVRSNVEVRSEKGKRKTHLAGKIRRGIYRILEEIIKQVKMDKALLTRRDGTIRQMKKRIKNLEREKVINKKQRESEGERKKEAEEKIAECFKGVEELEKEEAEITDKLEVLEECVDGLCKEIGVLGDLERKVEEHEKWQETLERRRRKCNVVIFGLEEKEGEDEKELQKWIKEKLGVKVEIEEMWYSGEERKRGKVIKCKNWGDKQRIMDNKNKLIGSKVFIVNDLTWKERKIQKRIREAYDRCKQKMIPGTKMGYRWLEADGRQFYWSEETNNLKEQVRQ